jgi:hypothetical protein
MKTLLTAENNGRDVVSWSAYALGLEPDQVNAERRHVHMYAYNLSGLLEHASADNQLNDPCFY